MMALKKDVFVVLFIINIVVNVISIFACFESFNSSKIAYQMYDEGMYLHCE